MSGSRRSSTTQSNCGLAHQLQGRGSRARGVDLHIVRPEQLRHAHLLGRIILHDEQAACARSREILQSIDGLLEPVGGYGLGDEGESAPLQPVLTLVLDSQDLHRDVPGFGAALQLVEHRPTQHVGQEYIE